MAETTINPADYTVQVVTGKIKKSSHSRRGDSPWKTWLRSLTVGTTTVLDVAIMFPDIDSKHELSRKVDQVRANIAYNAKRTEFDYEIWQESNLIYVFRKPEKKG